MRAIVLATLVVSTALSFCNWAAAQQPAAAAAASRTAEITVRGCVMGTNRYTLMQPSTGAVFALSGDTQRFSHVRGKLIEITGNEFAPQTNSSELPRLQAKSFRVIADKCPVQAHPPVGSANSQPATRRPGPAKSAETPPYVDPGTVNQAPPNVGNNPNTTGETGAPSPGTGNPSKPPQPPQPSQPQQPPQSPQPPQ